MLGGIYKKILDRMPAGIFVFDDRLRVRFTNAAFRRCFSDRAKGKGSLKEALGCGEEAKACGEGASCVYCAFRNVMQAAVKDRAEKPVRWLCGHQTGLLSALVRFEFCV